MKKLAILVTALLLCCGCSEKKQDDDISDNIPEVTTETEVPDTGNTVAETGFRTYKDDDFKTIKVSLSYPDKKAPVDVTSFLIPEHDYGAKIAPCKTSKDPSEYIFVADDPSFKDSDFLETPEKGVAEKAFLRDGKIYTIVNYDNMCIEGHEWSVYSYDTLKMKFDEVYSYSELSDYTPMLYNSFLIDDKLIFEMTMGTSTVLRSINLRNGREKDIYTLEDPMVVYSNGSDKLLLFIGGLDVALK